MITNIWCSWREFSEYGLDKKYHLVDFGMSEKHVGYDRKMNGEKEKVTIYRCKSFEGAKKLFNIFERMLLDNLDKEKFFDLYNKGKDNIGFCVRFNTWQVSPLDGGSLFDTKIVEI